MSTHKKKMSCHLTSMFKIGDLEMKIQDEIIKWKSEFSFHHQSRFRARSGESSGHRLYEAGKTIWSGAANQL